ncbi:MAG: dUTP diphosphatase [Parvibaculales bacterium]
MSAPSIKIKILPHGKELDLPRYETAGAAGMDLSAAIAEGETLTLAPNTHTLVPTGLIMAIPSGYEAQIRPRSGLANKFGVSVLNTPGTIDSDYRGEVQVMLINFGAQDFTIKRGDRIAQMIIAPIVQAQLQQVETLDETARGAGGFGSTGTGNTGGGNTGGAGGKKP